MGRGSSAYAGPKDTSAGSGAGGARTAGAGGGVGATGSATPTGGVRAATPTANPTGPATSAADPKATTRLDPAEWSTWWRFNGDAYLDLKTLLAGIDRTTPSEGDSSNARRGLSQLVVDTRALPALWSVIQKSGDTEMMRSAVIALGRVESSWTVADGLSVNFLAPQLLGDEHKQSAEATVIALGIAGKCAAVPTLIEILRDTPAGREAIKAGSVDYRRRSFAAYALALIGREPSTPAKIKCEIVRALMENMRSRATAPYDVQLACIISIGLVPLECCAADSKPSDDPSHVCRGEQLNFLLDLLDDEQRFAQLRAQAVIPLARLACDATHADFEAIRGALIAPLGVHSRAPAEVQQSCVIGLGLLGDDDADALDGEIRSTLFRVAAQGDRLSRALALISIAKNAARPGKGENDGKALAASQEFLLARLAHGDTLQRPWAAIALGVLGVERARTGNATPAEVTAAIRSALENVRSKDEAGAYCLGLGLLRDRAASTPLAERVAKGKEPGTRACAALALGLVGGREALDPLQTIFDTDRSDAKLLLSTSLALRLLGRGDIALTLAQSLRERANTPDGAPLARLLGLLGDARALTALCDVAQDPNSAVPVRGAACEAIGDLCDTRPRTWKSAISTDIHYALLSSTLLSYAASGEGILEMH